MVLVANTISTNEIIELITNGGTGRSFAKLLNATRILVLEEIQWNTTNTIDKTSVNISVSLIVRHLDNFRSKHKCKYSILSETRTHRDRQLLNMAGAQEVIVLNSLIERLLAKMVFNHGRIYEIVDQLVSLNSGIILESHVVKSGDAFNGQIVTSLFADKSSSYQVLGWLPKRMQSYLKRDTMGFSTHWITAFDGKRGRKTN